MKALLLGLVFASGCIIEERFSEPPPAEQPPGKQPSLTARQMFEQDVFPVLSKDCSDCHVSATPSTLNFMTTDAATTYPTVIADHGLVGDFTPKTAPILQVQSISGHQPMRYTADEAAKITAWLEQEITERQ
jgi:hypothetical protein